MPISSLVLTLEEPDQRAAVLATLARDTRITVGELLEGRWLPVVTDTPTLEEGASLAESLRELPGVRFLDVVLVDFSEGAR